MPEGHHVDDDERRLAELGYRQELSRSWSGFSNFAISFSIISILAGCFTTFGQAWNNGGPVAIAWGWPIISAFILIIGLCLAELGSAYPTAGGIYWWAAKLGGPRAGWYTGWFNLVGLIAVVASVSYGCASFLQFFLSLYTDRFSGLNWAFIFFVIIVGLQVLLNIFSAHLMAILNNVSVYWHVAGALVVVLILIFGPDSHQSLSFVFTERINNSGFSQGWYWIYVLPLGFLLTQYTITGFDASAHVSEETHGASQSVARGIWQSIFYSAIGGWILLLAFLFAATDVAAVNEQAGFVGAIFTSSLSLGLAKIVVAISTIGQFFCGMSCITSGSRMAYAFSRDRCVPGWQLWSRVNANRVPANAVLGVAAAALLITLPALKGFGDGNLPTAFFAVVSVAVIGLYLAFIIPIWLRWRLGDRFEAGPWTLGQRYRWLCPIAVAEIAIISVYFILPFSPAGWPGNSGFDWIAVNYAPIAIGAVILSITIWWQVSARKWFTGPARTVEQSTPAD